MKLTSPLFNFIIWKGYRIRLNLSYDTVLMVYEIWQDGTLTDVQKVQLSLNMLIVGWSSKIFVYLCNWDDKCALLSNIFDEHINAKGKSSKQERTFDFIQDAELIYAAFLMDYNIDLIDQQQHLDWRKFIALFSGLSDQTKIREVMGIRTRKLPTPTKYNTEEIQSLRDAKAFYALKRVLPPKANHFEEGLAQLFEILKARAQNEQ